MEPRGWGVDKPVARLDDLDCLSWLHAKCFSEFRHRQREQVAAKALFTSPFNTRHALTEEYCSESCLVRRVIVGAADWVSCRSGSS